MNGYNDMQKRAVNFMMGIKQLEMIWELEIDHCMDSCSVLIDSQTKEPVAIIYDHGELDFDMDIDD